MSSRILETFVRKWGNGRDEDIDVGSLITYPGFTYIGPLGLYVGNNLRESGISWEDSLEKVSDDGLHMLSPHQFWTYVQFCKYHKPEQFENLQRSNSREFLNMFVHNGNVYDAKHAEDNLDLVKPVMEFPKVGKIKKKFDFRDIDSNGFPREYHLNGEFTMLPKRTERNVSYAVIAGLGSKTFGAVHKTSDTVAVNGFRLAFEPNYYPDA